MTFHPGETVLLLMPLVLMAFLWWGWPRVCRAVRLKLAMYIIILAGAITGAEFVAAEFVGGRVLPWEVAFGIYFVFAWRLAWEVWKRTLGRLGESHIRLARQKKAATRAEGETRRSRPSHQWVLLIRPLRFSLVAFVLAPLLIGALIHRVKIGNGVDLGEFRALNIEPVSFKTADGLTLSGWFLPDKRSNSTVIVCHGAGANKGNFIGFLTLFYGEGFSSLIFDFRGHGDSDGHTTTFGLLESRDVSAAVDWLKKERSAQSRHVLAIGSSMGAMALVRAGADDQRIEAFVLDSCFTSAPDFARYQLGRAGPVGRALAPLLLASVSLHAGHSIWNLDAREAIERLSPRPVFLIHGDQDCMVAPACLDELYQRAKPPKEKWLGHGPHSNVLVTEYDDYHRRVIEFFRNAIASPTTQSSSESE